jgi:hypothetical protein
MHCHYCLEEMKEGASVCPHCRRVQPAHDKVKQAGSVVGQIALWAGVGLAVLLLLGYINYRMHKSTYDRQFACEDMGGHVTPGGECDGIDTSPTYNVRVVP